MRYSYELRLGGILRGDRFTIDFRFEDNAVDPALIKALKAACVKLIQEHGGQADLEE